MGSFSVWHWLIVLLIVVLVFGTKKLKNMGSDLGGAVKGFKDGVRDGGAAERRSGGAAAGRHPQGCGRSEHRRRRSQDAILIARVPTRMIDFGFDKIALIGAVALIVIGPEKLPRVARTVGHLIGKAQRYVADVKAEVNRSIELEELKKMKTQFEDAARNVEQTVSSEINQTTGRPRQRLAADEHRRCRPAAVSTTALTPLPPQYRHPKKNWRLKRGATPQWYKQRNGIRAKAQSGAARVARFRRRAAFSRRRARLSTGDKVPDELEGTEQPFVSHLIELRDRLIRASIAVGVCFGLLALWPGPAASTTCWQRRWSRTCPRARRLIATSVISPFLVPLKITLMAAFLLALPVVLYQVWAFVAPGLYTHEKRLVMPLVVSSTLLFFVGVGVLLLLRFRPGLQVHPELRAEEHHRGARHRGLPELRADDVHRVRRRVRGADRRDRAGAPGHRQHREAEGVPQLLHRAGVHRRRRHHAARRRLAARAGDPDGAALRGRDLGRADLHQAHAGAGRGNVDDADRRLAAKTSAGAPKRGSTLQLRRRGRAAGPPSPSGRAACRRAARRSPRSSAASAPPPR